MPIKLVTNKRPLIINKGIIINVLQYLFFLSIFLFSKTVTFGIIYRSQFQWIFYASCFLSLLISGISIETFKENLLICAPLIIFMSMQLVQINNFAADGFNTLAGQIMIFIACLCFATSITKEQFKSFYLITLTIVCLISIPCYYLSVYNLEFAKGLAVTDFVWSESKPNLYEYSYFYTWGSNGHFYGRNAGPFWEPGAFQGFIIIGIIIIINQITKQQLACNVRIKKFQLILYFFTLLTTRSTTGYIICLILLIVFFNKITIFFAGGTKYKGVVQILSAALVISAFIYIIASNNISDKLSGATTNSSEIRLNDLVQSINLVFSEHGLFGYGPTIEKDLIEKNLSLEQNSIGLLSMIYTYGYLFSIYYLIRMFLGLRKFYNNFNNIEFCTVLIIFVILHMTEGLWSLPIYVMLLMSFKKDSKYI